jgi:hypothetical protein
MQANSVDSEFACRLRGSRVYAQIGDAGPSGRAGSAALPSGQGAFVAEAPDELDDRVPLELQKSGTDIAGRPVKPSIAVKERRRSRGPSPRGSSGVGFELPSRGGGSGSSA